MSKWFGGVGIDIFYLALCWALTLTTSTLLTTIAPLSAKKLGASDTLAPFVRDLVLYCVFYVICDYYRLLEYSYLVLLYLLSLLDHCLEHMGGSEDFL